VASGALDANGVWIYDEDDLVSPLSDYENLGQHSTSTQFTADRARLTTLEAAALGDVPLGAFAPAWTNLTLGTGGTTNYAKYSVSKGVCSGLAIVTLGSTGFAVGDVFLTPPVPIAAALVAAAADVGRAQLIDTSAGAAGRFDGIVLAGASGLRVGPVNTAAAFANFAGMTSTTPFAWAANDKLAVRFNYPIA